MEYDRDVDSVLMNINKTAGGVVSAMLFSATMTFKLVTFLLRMTKKGLVASGLTDAFKNFSEKTSGEYTVYNIPLSKEKAAKMKELNKLNLELEKEKNPIKAASLRKEIKNIEKDIPEISQLKMLGIEHCVLPKVNGSNQTIQVGVANTDDQKFKNWYINHLTTGLNGGEKNVEAIKVFTEGNYSILNMPFEDKKELKDMFKDFSRMGVNYAKCPDLKVGDGYTQIAIPNVDRGRVEEWFSMWKDKQLADGKTVIKEMYVMDGSSYVSTGEITAEEYINGSEEIYKEANAEFEKNAIEVPWNLKMRHENSPEFIKLAQNNNYEKITINKETLVEGLETSNLEFLMKNAEEKGYFVSRVPGTYGTNQEALVLPKTQVFTTDDEKTYIAFINKSKSYMIVDSSGTVSKKSFDDVYASYDRVSRNFNKVNELRQGKSLEQIKNVAKNTVTKVPLPTLPKA